MFKKLLKELIDARTIEEVNEIFYRSNGVDLSYQNGLLTWKEYELLEKLTQKLNSLIFTY